LLALSRPGDTGPVVVIEVPGFDAVVLRCDATVPRDAFGDRVWDNPALDAAASGGAIINVSSVHQVIPKPRFLGYSVSKGGTFTGPGIAELLHSATIGICGGVTVDQLAHAVPSFPTVSEVWLELLQAYGL
jgi:hypothetical protein